MTNQEMGMMAIGIFATVGLVASLVGLACTIWFTYKLSVAALDDTTMHPWMEVQWWASRHTQFERLVRGAGLSMLVMVIGLFTIAIMIFAAQYFYGITPFFGAML